MLKLHDQSSTLNVETAWFNTFDVALRHRFR